MIRFRRHGGERMLRATYDWTMRQAESPRALWVLAFVAFIESSVFPIPPDVLIIPMVLAAPRRAWLVALVATVASVLGGILGYAIGAFAYETVGEPILASLGKEDAVAEFSDRFNDFGFWAVLIAGLTPFPYKVITIMSGFTAMPFGVFVGTSILARGARFFMVAALLGWLGDPARVFIERHLGKLTIAFVVLLAGGVYAMRYL